MTAAPTRIVGLDALRSLLLLAGVFVHASIFSDASPYAAIRYASSLFRMETFMLLAGLVATLSAARRGHGWLKRRLVVLLVPFVFGCLVLNPPTHYLIDLANRSTGFAQDYFLEHRRAGGWHLHLWFLLTLAILSPITPAYLSMRKIAPHGRAHRFFQRLGDRTSVALIMFVGLALVGFVVSRSLYSIPLIPADFRFVLSTVAQYAPFYIVGMLMAVHTGLYRIVSTPNKPLIAVTVLMIFVLVLFDQKGLWVPGFAFKIWNVIAGVAIANILVSAFSLIRSSNALLQSVVSAAYTVYMVHYLLVTIAILVLSEIGASPTLSYPLIVLFAVLGGYLLHQFIVSNSAFLSFLFNGQAKRADAPDRNPAEA